jgi:hypothetical protein
MAVNYCGICFITLAPGKEKLSFTNIKKLQKHDNRKSSACRKAFLSLVAKKLCVNETTLKNVNNCWNSSIHSSLETSGGQSCNLYLNVPYFFNASVN